MSRCQDCPRSACPLLEDDPTGFRCRSYLAARAVGPPAEPPSRPSPAPEPPRKLRPLAEALELRLLIQECPHLIPKKPGDGCGCIGRCKAGRGDMHGDRTSYRNCESCQAGELEGPARPDQPGASSA